MLKTTSLVWMMPAVFILLIPGAFGSIYWTSLFIMVLINILLTSSIRVIWLTGQISMGHAAFMMIGAYVSAILTIKAGFSFWLALPVSGLASGLVALVIGFPFLRVTGIYFSILTIMTSETLRHLAYSWTSMTGGKLGLSGIPNPGELTIPLLGTINFQGSSEYYYLTAVIVSVSLLILYLVEKSRYGLTSRAIKESSQLSGAVGINVLWYTVFNFVTACFFAGIAGSLFAHFQSLLTADSRSTFGIISTINFLLYMVIGGEKKFFGPAVGVAFVMVLTELSRTLQEYQSFFIGSLAILIVIKLPGGLIGIPQQIYSILKNTFVNTNAIHPPKSNPIERKL